MAVEVLSFITAEYSYSTEYPDLRMRSFLKDTYGSEFGQCRGKNRIFAGWSAEVSIESS